MTQNREYSMAGDLLKEVKEMQKVLPAEDAVESKISTTERCGALLTIICC